MINPVQKSQTALRLSFCFRPRIEKEPPSELQSALRCASWAVNDTNFHSTTTTTIAFHGYSTLIFILASVRSSPTSTLRSTLFCLGRRFLFSYPSPSFFSDRVVQELARLVDLNLYTQVVFHSTLSPVAQHAGRKCSLFACVTGTLAYCHCRSNVP